jgi:hypothetical protein
MWRQFRTNHFLGFPVDRFSTYFSAWQSPLHAGQVWFDFVRKTTEFGCLSRNILIKGNLCLLF